jgi:hypothetical protein
MKLIRPITITDSVLTGTNVAESETQWSAVTTYALAATVRGTGDNAHNMYMSLQASNLNHAVTETAWWQHIGSSNRYSMYDQSPQSQTTNADSIYAHFTVPGRIDSVGLQNVSASAVRVILTDAIDGVVYDETYSMVSTAGITDWYAYFFEPIERLTEITVTDLKPYANPTLEIYITETGATVACGLCVSGLSKDLGGTQWGGTVGIQDYSVKSVDDFGYATIVERAYSKTANFTSWINSGQFDTIYSTLATYRATPVLYVANDDFGATSIYGFFDDFQEELSYEDKSLVSLQIKGLA